MIEMLILAYQQQWPQVVRRLCRGSSSTTRGSWIGGTSAPYCYWQIHSYVRATNRPAERKVSFSWCFFQCRRVPSRKREGITELPGSGRLQHCYELLSAIFCSATRAKAFIASNYRNKLNRSWSLKKMKT